MWICPKCKEPIEDAFDSCWKCAGDAQQQATPKPGAETESFEKLELVCVLLVAMPGIFLFTGGRVLNAAQAVFRFALFAAGLTGIAVIQILKRTKNERQKRKRLLWQLALALGLAGTLAAFAGYKFGYLRACHYTEYSERLDFAGIDLIGLSGAPKARAKALIPMLKDMDVMSRRVRFASELRASDGEVADEVHDFLDAHQGNQKLKRLLLKNGRVIEVIFQW